MTLLEKYKQEFIKNYKLFKNKKTRKQEIPNILTLSRLLSPIIIIPLVLKNKYNLALIFILIFALTDLLDGYIARKYNYVSKLGREIDPVCDKIFLGSLLIPLIIKKQSLLVNILLELIISIICIINKIKGYNTKVNGFGKFKTAFIYTLISYTYLNLFINTNNNIYIILYILTIILQVSTIITYLTRTIKKEQEEDIHINSFGYKLIRPIFKVFFNLYFRPKVIGKENIPKEGPFILCGNHTNVHDQFPIMMNTKRVIHYIAKKEYFDSKMGFFFRFVGQIPVDRENKDTNAKEEAIEVLKHNHALGIFPEGTRNVLVYKNDIVNNLYPLVEHTVTKEQFIKILKDNQTKLSQLHLLDKLKETSRIKQEEYNSYLLDLPNKLKHLLKNNVITEEEYRNSLLLDFKYGAVSFASKTDAYILPYATCGRYLHHSKDLRIIIGKPFKVGNLSLEEANQKLRNTIIDIIIKNSK